MMKLYALRDQWESAEKGFGRKHAIDLYTLIALMTEPEYHTSQELSRRYQVNCLRLIFCDTKTVFVHHADISHSRTTTRLSGFTEPLDRLDIVFRNSVPIQEYETRIIHSTSVS
ncbi:MAG: hypothetical protein JWL77_2779 [Chthonomonadaceae bacterium]|nr:hypothetical protein [Chthonomonadaceae bacterium]